MIADAATVAWKEWKELFSARGGRRSALVTLFLPLAVVAVVLPLQAGRAWVTSGVALITWAWLPLFLVVNVIADSFAGERERHTLETLLASRLPDRAILLGKIAAAVLYAWLLTLAMLALALVTVNVAHGRGELLMFPPAVAAGAVGLSLLAAVLAASAGVMASLRAPTARQAQQTVNMGVMLLLFVPLFGIQFLPVEWRNAITSTFAGIELASLLAVIAGAMLAIDAALLLVVTARFQRARLILD